jgi:hypothetical protein
MISGDRKGEGSESAWAQKRKEPVHFIPKIVMVLILKHLNK